MIRIEPPTKVRRLEPTLQRPAGVELSPNPSATVADAIRHDVVSQLLRPDVAAFVPPECWASTLKTQPGARVGMDTIDYAAEQLPCLTALDFSYTDIGTPGLARIATTIPTLQRLDLYLCGQVKAAALNHVLKLTELQSLDVGFGDGLSTAWLQKVAETLTKLKTLTISRCGKLRAPGLAHLVALPQLQKLDIGGCENIGSDALAHVAELSNLTHLTVDNSMKIDSDGHGAIATLPKLEFLDVHCSVHFDNASLAEVAKVSTLQHLNISQCPSVDATGLAHVAKLAQLRHLNLHRCRGLDAPGLLHVAQLPRLEHLDLSNCEKVDATGLLHIAKMPQMKCLILSHCRNVDATAIDHVAARATQLQRLEITGCRGIDTSTGFKSLSCLSKLTHLNMSYLENITESALACVGKLQQLEHLDMSYCSHVDGNGFAHIAKLPYLQELVLWKCSHMANTAGLALLKDIPTVRQ